MAHIDSGCEYRVMIFMQNKQGSCAFESSLLYVRLQWSHDIVAHAYGKAARQYLITEYIRNAIDSGFYF